MLLLNEENRGLTATLNAALARVETPYYAYISGDDLMRADRFERQLPVLAADPGLAFVYSDAEVVDEGGVVVGASFVSRFEPLGAEDTFDGLLVGNWIPAPSVLARTAAVREVGGYDETLFLEDHDLWLRLADRFTFTHVDDALVSWRELSTSLGARMFRDEDPEWALTRIRIRAKHWGRDPHTDRDRDGCRAPPVAGPRPSRCAGPHAGAVPGAGRPRRPARHLAGLRPGGRHRLHDRPAADRPGPATEQAATPVSSGAQGGTRTRTPEGTRT